VQTETLFSGVSNAGRKRLSQRRRREKSKLAEGWVVGLLKLYEVITNATPERQIEGEVCRWAVITSGQIDRDTEKTKTLVPKNI